MRFDSVGNLGVGISLVDTYNHGGTNIVTQIYNSGTSLNSQAHILIGSGAASQTLSSVGSISWGLPTASAANHGLAYITCITGSTSTSANPTGRLVFATRSSSDSTFIDRMSLSESGSLNVTGSVSKGSGSFVIDHPLNETKNLVHSFIEGPRADLIYRGTVSLIDGSVTINLDEEYELIPGTWKALCRNPQVWISNIDGWTNCRGTVEDGILIIEAQYASNESVNWLVIAERQDKHMYDTEWTDSNGRPILEPVKL